MASTILNSARAVEMSVYVVRAFAQLETRLEKRLTEHDQAIAAILSAIRELMHSKPPGPKRRPIGFTADLEQKV